MKKLSIILTFCFAVLLTKAQVPIDTNELRTKVNAWLIPNGTKSITATQINQLFNGVLNLMNKYSVNHAYRVADTLFLTGSGMATIKVTLNTGGTSSESDPTVPLIAKSLTSTDTSRWNQKQEKLIGSSTVSITANVLTVPNGSALWNSNKLQGRDVANTIPSLNQVLLWNGAAWAPAIISKASVDLSNVDNTSDIEKPVSTAQQAALNDTAQSIRDDAFSNLQKKSLFGNGMTYANDSVKIGGKLENWTFIQASNRLMDGAPRAGLYIGTNRWDSAANYLYLQSPTGIYNEAAPPLSVVQGFYDNDTVPKHYGGAIRTNTRWTFSPGLKRYTNPLTPFYPLYGGTYSVAQIFPPDSMYINANWAGRVPSAFAGDLALGGNNGYWMNIVSDQNYPMTAMRLGIDFARQNSLVKREIYGQGTSIYLADTRHHQSPIDAGTTEYGSYVNRLTLFDGFGLLGDHSESPSKGKTIAVSKIDTAIAFRARPLNKPKNEVQNGFGFVAEGTADFNWMAKYLRVGGALPTVQTGGQANEFEVFGRGYFKRDFTPIIVESANPSGFPEVRFKNHRGNWIGAVGGINADRSMEILVDSGAFRIYTGKLGGIVGLRMFVAQTGAVGIGTETDTTALFTVAGTSKINGSLTLAGLSGAGTRVITANPAGVTGTVTNGADGQLLTMVSGSPAWADAPTSGTYNPTFSNLGTGVSSVAAVGSKVWYTRVGKTVTITGRIDPVFSSGVFGDTRTFSMSLPPGMTAVFTSYDDAQGVGNCTWNTTRSVVVQADEPNDIILFTVKIGSEGFGELLGTHFTVTFSL